MAVSRHLLISVQRYSIVTEFNSVVVEHHMKWKPLLVGGDEVQQYVIHATVFFFFYGICVY